MKSSTQKGGIVLLMEVPYYTTYICVRVDIGILYTDSIFCCFSATARHYGRYGKNHYEIE